MKSALVVLLAAFAVAAAGCGSSGSRPAPGPPAAGGQLLEAPQAQVVEYPDGSVWICPPYADGGVAGLPAAPNCRGGLPAKGIKVDGLHSHVKGVHWGLLHVMGVYRDGTFWVRSQGPWRVAPNPYSPFEGPVPCRAPSGGWRSAASPESQRATIGAYQRAHRGDLVSVSFFRNVLVVASSHPARTRALLGPDWPKQICVVRSTYSRPFVNRVREKVLGLMRPVSRAARYGWVTGAGGYGVNARGETTISLQVLIETQQLRAFLRLLPRGIVALESEFQPAREGQA
jgi:hypothetical protein